MSQQLDRFDTDRFIAPPPIRQVQALVEDAPVNIPGEIKLDDQGRLLKTWFEFAGNVGSLIEGYDHWTRDKLPRQLASRTLQVAQGPITLSNPIFVKPRLVVSDSEWHPIFPRDAKDGGRTYAAELYVDLVLNKGLPNEQTSAKKVYLGLIPVMVGSWLCNTTPLKESCENLLKVGECVNNPGGYFIIKGTERQIITQEKLRVNRIFIFNNSSKGEVVCKITNETILGPSVVVLVHNKKTKAMELHLGFMKQGVKKTSSVGVTISVFQVFRMLLGDKMTAKAVLRWILVFTKPEWCQQVANVLAPSLVMLDNIGDDIAYLSNEMGLGNKDYETKKTEILTSLLNELFPQISIRKEDEESMINASTEFTPLFRKLGMFAMMIAYFAEHLAGLRPYDDRDNWSNKRLETAGRSMEQLFTAILKRAMTKAQDELDKKSTETLANAKVDVIADEITSNFIAAFAPNKWGVKGPQPRKENITDVLKYENLMSLYSALNKINTPTSRRAKAPQIRLVNMTQLGFGCPIQTPEGEQCLRVDQLVLMADGSMRAIGDLNNGDRIVTVNPQTLIHSTSMINSHFVKSSAEYGKDVVKIETLSGRSIVATVDHPVLTPTGWVDAGKLKCESDLVCVVPTVKHYDHVTDKMLVLSSESFRANLQKIGIKDTLIEKHGQDLTSMGLLPLYSTNVKLPLLARVSGLCVTDGHLGMTDGVPRCSFKVGTEIDADELERDIETLGFNRVKISRVETKVKDAVTGRETIHNCLSIQHSGPIGSFLLALGLTWGRKTEQENMCVPAWIVNGSTLVKREWLAGFQGGDGCKMTWTKTAKKVKAGRFGFHSTSQQKHPDHKDSLVAFMETQMMLFNSFGIETFGVTVETISEDRIQVAITFSNAESNLITYMSEIGYRYAHTKTMSGHNIAEYLRYKHRKIQERVILKNVVFELYSQGMKQYQIAKKLGIRPRLIGSIIENGATTYTLSPKDTLGFEEWTASTVLTNTCLFEPIASISKEEPCMVADFTTENDDHTFVSNGIVTHNCGLVKQSAITNWISVEQSEQIIWEHIKLDRSDWPNASNKAVLWMNGKYMGWCDGPALRKKVIAIRRRSANPFDTTCVIFDGRVLHIYTDPGRPTRPLLVVNEETGRLVIDELNLWGKPFQVIQRAGAIEYIDAFEQEYTTIAQNIDDLKMNIADQEAAIQIQQEHLESLVNLSRQQQDDTGPFDPDAIDKMAASQKAITENIQRDQSVVEALVKKTKFTHCELDPTAIMGTSASLIPLPDHNQGPRNTFQTSMGNQSMGIVHSNLSTRFDTTAKALAYPSRPLFETQMYRVLGLDEMPAGQTVIGAIMTYGGFNQEDSIIFNQGSIDRGLFLMVVTKSYKAIAKSTGNSEVTETFEYPAVKKGDPMLYEALDSNGIARVGADVGEGYVLISKKRRIGRPPSHIDSYEQVVVGVGITNARVDKVMITTNAEGNRVAFVRIRQIRKPEEGDKFAPRHAQKGTAAAIYPEADMPEVAYGPNKGMRPDIIINPHCFPADTPVTLPCGISREIGSFSADGGEKVWSCDDTTGGLVQSHSLGQELKGLKSLVKVHMEDGRSVKCTPDHKFLTINNGTYEWVQASELPGKRVATGLDAPLDKPELDVGSEWSLSTVEYTFDLKTSENREKSLAFARILGYVLTDGCVSARDDLTHGYASTVCLGHMLDAEVFVADVNLITGKTPAITDSKGVYNVRLPAPLSGAIGKLPGVQHGHRASQATTWPDFIVDTNCPLSVLREFLGGLFGGDGITPHIIDRKGIDGGATFLVPGGFSQTAMVDHATNLETKMQQLADLLERLCVPVARVDKLTALRVSETSYRPSDGIKRLESRLHLTASTAFGEKVGFRYCIQKMCRISAANAYWRFQESVKAQHDKVAIRANDLYEAGYARGRTNKRSLEVALQLSRAEFMASEISLNDHYALSNLQDMRNRRAHDNFKLTQFDYAHIPDAAAFFKSIGVFSWFERVTSAPNYIVKRGSNFVPSFNLKVVGVTKSRAEKVYDIGVAKTHSFLANGLTVHNCIPSRMTIGMLIEIVASKLAAITGERMNATAFRNFDINQLMANLRQYGFSGGGKEVMKSGTTGKLLRDVGGRRYAARIFIGPCYYQALRHNVLDKIQMRQRGPVKQQHRQPVSGRANRGGQRLGEMERDALSAHGASALLKERLCLSSDAYTTVFCSRCGTVAIANHEDNSYTCRTCGDDGKFGTCTVPYAYKLLLHLLSGAGFRVTHKMTEVPKKITRKYVPPPVQLPTKSAVLPPVPQPLRHPLKRATVIPEPEQAEVKPMDLSSALGEDETIFLPSSPKGKEEEPVPLPARPPIKLAPLKARTAPKTSPRAVGVKVPTKGLVAPIKAVSKQAKLKIPAKKTPRSSIPVRKPT